MPRKAIKTEDISTEAKIKSAAISVFTKKGYAATRTRDIADEAGINLALLNYYFRSKEKLFAQVMAEKVQQLFGIITPVLNDLSLTIESKTERIVSNYIDMLTEHPDLPLFVLNEIRNNAEHFSAELHLGDLLQRSHLAQQLKEKNPAINPLQYILSILGMTVFPFVARPVFQAGAGISDRGFRQMMQERKKLVPLWVKAMLKAK